MSETETIDRVRDLLGTAADLLTDADLNDLLPQAVTPDSEGRSPSHPEWEPTWDVYWLAADAAELLGIRAAGERTLTRVTAEGATFEWTQANFAAMANRLRRLSPLARLGSDFGTITLPAWGPRWAPTSRGWPWGTR